MKRGRKPDHDRKIEIYTTWKLLTETWSLDDIGKRIKPPISGERVRQVVKEMNTI